MPTTQKGFFAGVKRNKNFFKIVHIDSALAVSNVHTHEIRTVPFALEIDLSVLKIRHCLHFILDQIND